MKQNALNNDYVKALGFIAGLSSIAFSIYRKTTFLKGVGNYFLFTISGSIIGAGIYQLTKK